MATLTQSQIYTIALAAGLPQPKVMAAIAMAESSGRTDVVNSIGCVGLWQINQPVHVHANPTWTKEWLKNPYNNAIAAKKILASQGLRAWEVYTNGMYAKYLNKPVQSEAKGGVTPAGWWDDFKDLLGPPDWDDFKKGWDLGQETGDAILDVISVPGLEGITEGIKSTADFLVNPRSWLRISYGVVGAVLVVGGLFLIVRNTPAVQQSMGKVQAAAKSAATKGAA